MTTTGSRGDGWTGKTGAEIVGASTVKKVSGGRACGD